MYAVSLRMPPGNKDKSNKTWFVIVKATPSQKKEKYIFFFKDSSPENDFPPFHWTQGGAKEGDTTRDYKINVIYQQNIDVTLLG